MSIELAEKLKAKLTDQWVIVDNKIPELKRFAQFTGKVRTVNMNGRALVQFDNEVDISWYDIDPAFLTVVDGPRPKKPAEAITKPAQSKPAPAAPAAPSSAAQPSSPIPAGGKLSPLDLIRKQQAEKKAAEGSQASSPNDAPGTAPVQPVVTPSVVPQPVVQEEAAVESAPVPAPRAAADEENLSPIERIRRMGAAKKS